MIIQDMETYRSKIFEILQIDGKFNKISSDETVKRDLQNYLRSLKILDDTDCKRILWFTMWFTCKRYVWTTKNT